MNFDLNFVIKIIFPGTEIPITKLKYSRGWNSALSTMMLSRDCDSSGGVAIAIGRQVDMTWRRHVIEALSTCVALMFSLWLA